MREVDSPERVGLVVSVLHLPPGSQVTATYMKDGLAPERPGAGEWGALRLCSHWKWHEACGRAPVVACPAILLLAPSPSSPASHTRPPACLPARCPPAEWRAPEGDEVPKGGASAHCRTWLVLSDRHSHVGHLSKEVRACPLPSFKPTPILTLPARGSSEHCTVRYGAHSAAALTPPTSAVWPLQLARRFPGEALCG